MELIYYGFKKYFLFFCLLFSIPSLQAQTGLPKGSCGIQYTYDAAGNMADRQYVCNNAAAVTAVKETGPAIGKMPVIVQAVDVLYPNPTTGRFTLRMVKPLKNAQIAILDMQGRMIERRTASGNSLQFDLSPQAAGMYILQIRDEGETFTAKVVKH